MLILVANLGSTSFKYKLFRMPEERVLAAGGAERIGEAVGAWSAQAGGDADRGETAFPDHAAAIDLHLRRLLDMGVIESLDDIGAIGFKAVHGGPISDAVRVDDRVIETIQRFSDVAPAHNPPYVAAMKAFRDQLPDADQVAAFETGFHQTIPLARQVYGIPHQWTESLGIRRYGFHGASHRFIATRMAEIAPDARRIINFHLGGSSSVCAIRDGESIATSMGMTPQSGLLQNNRVGDFDVFALRKLTAAGLGLDEILDRLGREGGWLGVSGVSGDVRDVEAAAAKDDGRAQLAIDAFVEGCRHYMGAYLVALGGIDAVTFTGGIGQHGDALRAAICADLAFVGIDLDPTKNTAATGKDEQRVESSDSRTQIWILPTNEEIIVARQTAETLRKSEIRNLHTLNPNPQPRSKPWHSRHSA